MIELANVCKRLGAKDVLTDVSLRVSAGEVVGFVGKNGAGKSTTLRILCGFIDADSGRVVVGGHDIEQRRREAQRLIGYLPENAPLYPDMRVDEYLRFRGRIKEVPRARLAECLDEVITRLSLSEVRSQIVGRLSRGFRQRVGIADALIANPPVLVLDEPTTGLDPAQNREFRDLLSSLGEDRAVLISSHHLAELESIATRLIVISGGRIVASGSATSLREQVGKGADTALEEVFLALSEEPPC